MNKSPIYDPVKRRCVVNTVLKDFLSTDYHMQALWILENDYAKQHSLPILEYIDQIEKLAAIGDKKKELRERLTKELYFSENIGSDPWDEMVQHQRIKQIKVRKVTPESTLSVTPAPIRPVPNQEQAQQTASTVKIDTNDVDESIPVLAELVSTELVVFSGLLKELVKQFEHSAKNHVAKLYGYVLAMASELDISPDVEANLVAWCQNKGQIVFNDVLETEEMSEIVHACYTWAAEYLGPDDADEIFVRAVHEVEKLPEAKDFHPSNFL